jgi:hypothetical protein
VKKCETNTDHFWPVLVPVGGKTAIENKTPNRSLFSTGSWAPEGHHTHTLGKTKGNIVWTSHPVKVHRETPLGGQPVQTQIPERHSKRPRVLVRAVCNSIYLVSIVLGSGAYGLSTSTIILYLANPTWTSRIWIGKRMFQISTKGNTKHTCGGNVGART